MVFLILILAKVVGSQELFDSENEYYRNLNNSKVRPKITFYRNLNRGKILYDLIIDN